MTRLRGASKGALFSQLERLFRHGTSVGSSEGELLERFVAERDQVAFEAIIARHGRMVLGVCRQLLRDPNDVDDAFQATFLVLVRKAGTLRRTELLGNWLYGVAYRVATRARGSSARRAARNASGQDSVENLTAPECQREIGVNQITAFEEGPWLHEELSHLPEKYRVPIVLCYFEGLTHDEAASRLGWPLGTVKGRLARARDLLRRRLTVRGVTLSATAVATQLTLAELKAGVPESLRMATLKAARAVTCRAGLTMTAVSGVSLPVASLVEGVVQAMRLTQLRTITVPLLLAAATIATGVVVGAPRLADDPAEGQTTQPASKGVVPAHVEGRASGERVSEAVSKKATRPPSQQSSMTSATAADLIAPPADARDTQTVGSAPVGSPRPRPVGDVPGGTMRANAAARGKMSRQYRAMIAARAAAIAADDTNPQSKAILKKLEEPIPMSFDHATPLGEVLKYIKQATTSPNSQGVAIYVDLGGLLEADVTLNSVIIIDLEGVPLKTTLRLALKQLDLAYCVHDGVLIISSVLGITAELTEAENELEARNPQKSSGLQ